jgi:hypothetical protein
MSTKEYLNENYKKITAQQAEMCSEFIEVYYDNSGLPKKNLTFNNGKLEWVEYFLGNEENPNIVLQQYEGVGRMALYKNAVISGIYRKYDVEYYDSNQILERKSIEVFKGFNVDENLPIYLKTIDPVTDAVIYFEKAFYDNENNLTYIFTYDSDTGNFINLNIEDPAFYVDTDDHDFGSDDIGIGNNPYDFDWEGFEYYQNAEPVIPE